ncbi:MAG: CDP-alcohol phosphatidyltransferase family protein [Rickettsiales bacterium]|jgi:CDP-diacylglycerol--serine O-phosphatidyltransferase|nr:CDP-alcohol phosphatidyltransferase family protein [Rickettsiales bacterium]
MENGTKRFEILRIIPNLVTIFALSMGLLAMRLAIFDNFRGAALCVIVSCLFDKFDGNIARKLNVSSSFGAQMDSLADFFDFGIVPGFIVYLWVLKDGGFTVTMAWLAVLLLATCMAIRLARFNVSLIENDSEGPRNKYFFKGIPAPMAASLVLLPLVLSFEYQSLNINSKFVVANTVLVAILAGSTVPTPCFKKIKFGPVMNCISTLAMWIFLAGLVLRTWLTAIFVCFLYIITIFASWVFYYRFSKYPQRYS